MSVKWNKPQKQRLAVLALAALLASASGQAAEQLAAAQDAPAAPACKLSLDKDAAPAELAQYRGQVVYVDFWASWCGPCRQSFPFMNQMQSDFGDKGLTVVAVNLGEEASDAQSFLANPAASFKIAGGANQECAAAFHVEAMPSSYLIDRAGKVRYIHHGFRTGDAELLRTLTATLLAEPATTP
ncbi:MAG: TlpA family protein disulfide reductase [Gammaproteobacteria bacterium]|nr:TlpA family protein disulfide reductase [Gammaproteobacteria bacterium]